MKKIYYYLIGILALIISFIFDKQISLFFTSYRIEILNLIALFFDKIKGYTIFIIIFGILLIKRQNKKILPLLVSFILYLGLTNLIKITVARPRPFVNLENALVNNTDSYRSFPSGHATAVFTLLPFLDFIKVFWLIISILVALSRVYLGVHYLSDIIMGAMLGYFIGDLSLYLVKKYKERKILHHRKI